MLKKTLIITMLTICGIINIQANEENEKDLTPGVLVCNSDESQCSKEEGQEESISSILFSVFCEDDQDEQKVLACKDCL